jgi:hypothetical protein
MNHSRRVKGEEKGEKGVSSPRGRITTSQDSRICTEGKELSMFLRDQDVIKPMVIRPKFVGSQNASSGSIGVDEDHHKGYDIDIHHWQIEQRRKRMCLKWINWSRSNHHRRYGIDIHHRQKHGEGR